MRLETKDYYKLAADSCVYCKDGDIGFHSHSTAIWTSDFINSQVAELVDAKLYVSY